MSTAPDRQERRIGELTSIASDIERATGKDPRTVMPEIEGLIDQARKVREKMDKYDMPPKAIDAVVRGIRRVLENDG